MGPGAQACGVPCGREPYLIAAVLPRAATFAPPSAGRFFGKEVMPMYPPTGVPNMK